MSRDHLVPQMMIRRFAGADGKLVELHKPALSIGTRRRAPKGILFVDDYYRDSVGNLDDALFKPIEQRFAAYYPFMADETPPRRLPPKGGSAFVDWVASLLVRTRLYPFVTAILAARSGPIPAALQILNPRLLANTARDVWFSEYQDLLSRPHFKWKIWLLPPAHSLVLSDNPVCLGRCGGTDPTDNAVIVPISRHRVMFGGRSKAIERFMHISVGQLNAYLAAWSDKRVYAAERADLEYLAQALRGGGPLDPEWCAAARQPYCGLGGRIGNGPQPAHKEDWWDDVKERYGKKVVSG